MSDLISRAAAIAEVEEWAEHGHDLIHWTGIKAMLEIQPAVDAAPVVHGRWNVILNPFWDVECSECGYAKKTNWEMAFCPNCGAKMDGGERDG